MGYAACEVSYIGGTQKWIVYDGTSYSSMDDLGVPPHSRTPRAFLRDCKTAFFSQKVCVDLERTLEH